MGDKLILERPDFCQVKWHSAQGAWAARAIFHETARFLTASGMIRLNLKYRAITAKKMFPEEVIGRCMGIDEQWVMG